ncbi:MAG: AEC family transporter [Clostridia bacterium]|nr:AEC family transporter [Clostridia bacterium]
MYFLSTFLGIAVLIILLVPGFVLRKTKLVSDTAAKDLSSVLIYIGIPALIVFCMMSVDITLVTPTKIIVCVLLSLFIHFFAYALVKLAFLKSEEKGKKAAASFSAIFSNCGFLGIPITQMAVKYCETFTQGVDSAMSEAMLYVSLFNVIFNLLNWTLGVGLYSNGEKKSALVKKAILNPCVIATVICLPFTLTGFSLLKPIIIGDFEITQISSLINYLYNLCVPVSMCILGIRLADVKFRPMLKSKFMYASVVIKLIITPAVILGLCILLNALLGIGKPLALSMVIMSATPSATTALAFAERFNGDKTLASECIVSSTLLSVVTLPLFMTLAIMI